jgi:hypothetical protein
MPYIYPRLGSQVATQLLTEYSRCTPRDLVSAADTSHPQAGWYPTGVAFSVPIQKLGNLQDATRHIAMRYGYPEFQRARSATPFDQEVGTLLTDLMDILPADAAQEGVWSFISLVLLPDVAFWRWPNQQGKENYERLIGRPRNVFRRLWWRSYCIGDDLARELLEDEAVAIMERPSFGGCPKVARAIASTHLRYVHVSPGVSRTEVLRQATKRLRRISPVVTLYALSEADLAVLLDEIFSGALKWCMTA